jgi:hypothetical protein
MEPDPDRPGAEETVYALAADGEVRAAALYTIEGKLFAKYRNRNFPNIVIPDIPTEKGTRDWFSVVVPVTVGAQQFGNLYVEHSLEKFNHRVFSFALSVLVAALLLSVFAAVMARFLQGQFSDPVHILADTARGFTRLRDFSLRAATTGDTGVQRPATGIQPDARRNPAPERRPGEAHANNWRIQTANC